VKSLPDFNSDAVVCGCEEVVLVPAKVASGYISQARTPGVDCLTSLLTRVAVYSLCSTSCALKEVNL
jgi:hypothetical protein